MLERRDRERPHRRSDAHRHHDGEELPSAPTGLHDGRIELAAEAELDLVFVERAEHVEEVLRVEADGQFGPAYSTGTSSKPSPLSGDSLVIRIVPFASAELHAAGALARGDRHGAQRVGERARAGRGRASRSAAG